MGPSWPLPIGRRPAIRYGGLHGSSAVGHGDIATMVLLSWCLVRQWRQVPASTYCGGASFCSSSSGGYCSFYRDRYAQCNLFCCSDVQMTVEIFQVQLWTGFDLPVVVHRHMHCPRVSRSSISVVAQLQILMVLIQRVCQLVTRSLWTCTRFRESSERQCPWLSVQKTAKVPQLHCSLKWPMSLLCRSCWCRRCCCGRQHPCDHTATSSSLFSSRGASDSVHPPVVVDILLCNRDWYEALWRR